MTTKLYLKSCNSEMMITNQTNDVVNITLYDVVARRDLTGNSANEALYITPDLAWQQGCIDAGASSVYSTVGSTPFQTPGFTEFFKIRKITHVDLHSGGHHRHRQIYDSRCMFSNEIVTELASSGGVLGGRSAFTLVVAHGFPVNSTGTSTVSTASGKIVWAQKLQYEYMPFTTQRTIITQTDNLPVLATESFINDLTGVAATITKA